MFQYNPKPKSEVITVLEKYHHKLQEENMKADADKSVIFLSKV